MEEVAAKCGDNLTRENVNELKYVDQVKKQKIQIEKYVEYVCNMFCFQFLQEVGRFIAVTFTARVCTKEWELPGFPGVVIPKGMKVLIAVDPVQVI